MSSWRTILEISSFSKLKRLLHTNSLPAAVPDCPGIFHYHSELGRIFTIHREMLRDLFKVTCGSLPTELLMSRWGGSTQMWQCGWVLPRLCSHSALFKKAIVVYVLLCLGLLLPGRGISEDSCSPGRSKKAGEWLPAFPRGQSYGIGDWDGSWVPRESRVLCGTRRERKGKITKITKNKARQRAAGGEITQPQHWGLSLFVGLSCWWSCIWWPILKIKRWIYSK